MTCILVAHLGAEVVIAADKRVVVQQQDGSREFLSDDVDKIVRTPSGVVTGCGLVEMLDPVKELVSGGFSNTDDVLELILETRSRYAASHADSSFLLEDLALTSWVLTYCTSVDGKEVVRVVCYHQSLSPDKLVVIAAGRVMCFPGCFTLEQAQQVQDNLQAVVTEHLDSLSYEDAKEQVIAHMVWLMDEVSQISDAVSSICDVAVTDGCSVQIALGVSTLNDSFRLEDML